MTGEVIYLAQLAPTRAETPHERLERLVKEASAHWTDAAVLQRACEARKAGLHALPSRGATLADDFMSRLSLDRRVFVGEVAADALRQLTAKGKAKSTPRVVK